MARRPVLKPDQQTAFNDALFTGISRKDTEMINLALDKGADPDLLLFAAIDDKKTLKDRFRSIGKTGSALSNWNRGSSLKDSFNEISPQELADTRKLDWARTAVRYGANVNATRDGGGLKDRPAVHALHDNFNKALMTYLLSNGVAADVKDPGGDTLLMRAVRDGDAERVSYYLDRGADPMKPCGDRSEYFPLQALQGGDKFGKKTKARLLKEMMAHVKPPPAPSPLVSAPKPEARPAPPPPPKEEAPRFIRVPEPATFAKKEPQSDPPPAHPVRKGFAI